MFVVTTVPLPIMKVMSFPRMKSIFPSLMVAWMLPSLDVPEPLWVSQVSLPFGWSSLNAWNIWTIIQITLKNRIALKTTPNCAILYLLAVWFRASYLVSSSLNCLICKPPLGVKMTEKMYMAVPTCYLLRTYYFVFITQEEKLWQCDSSERSSFSQTSPMYHDAMNTEMSK